jgi:hypothetical protein
MGILTWKVNQLIEQKKERKLTAFAEFPELFQPALIDKFIRVTIRSLENV